MAVLANERIRLGRRATRRQGAALLSYTFDMAAQFNFFDQHAVRAVRYSALSFGKRAAFLFANSAARVKGCGFSVLILVSCVLDFSACAKEGTLTVRRLTQQAIHAMLGRAQMLLPQLSMVTTASTFTHFLLNPKEPTA